MAEWLGASLIIPDNDAPNGNYFRAQSGSELRLPKCTACGMFQYPPRSMCPDCRNQEFRYEAVSGRGTIHSYFILSQPIQAAFLPHPETPVALIELDEQRGVGLGGDRTRQPNEFRALRLVGNIVKADGSFEDPANVAVNKRVQVKIIDLGDGMGLPQWVLSDEPPAGPLWQVPGG
ncbi:MAG: zinc ribbon domain-containing protein [Dehalococcoidia bacterium]